MQALAGHGIHGNELRFSTLGHHGLRACFSRPRLSLSTATLASSTQRPQISPIQHLALHIAGEKHSIQRRELRLIPAERARPAKKCQRRFQSANISIAASTELHKSK